MSWGWELLLTFCFVVVVLEMIVIYQGRIWPRAGLGWDLYPAINSPEGADTQPRENHKTSSACACACACVSCQWRNRRRGLGLGPTGVRGTTAWQASHSPSSQMLRRARVLCPASSSTPSCSSVASYFAILFPSLSFMFLVTPFPPLECPVFTFLPGFPGSLIDLLSRQLPEELPPISTFLRKEFILMLQSFLF